MGHNGSSGEHREGIVSKWEKVRDGPRDREGSALPGPCGYSVMDWMACVSPLSSYVKTLIPNVTGFAEDALRR